MYKRQVSVFKELARRWKPEIYSGFKKASKHEALADIYESIDELKYYREHFIVKWTRKKEGARQGAPEEENNSFGEACYY